MRDAGVVLIALAGVLLGVTWIGYPAWLWLRSRAHSRPLPGGPVVGWPFVTIVVIVRRPDPSLGHLLLNLRALAYPTEQRRTLLVCDTHSDFDEAVAAMLAHRGVDVLRVTRLQRGAAEAVAQHHVRGDLVVVVHPTARPRPGALAALVSPFADPTVGVVYGHEVPAEPMDLDARVGESPLRRWEGWLRDRETRVFGTVSARGTLYAVRTSIYRAGMPAPSPDFALALWAREHGYRAVYARDARCVVKRDPSPREEYARRVRAVARDVATLVLAPRLLNPRRYGEFAWMLLGHKLGRWLSPWALLAGLAGLALLMPSQEWARLAGGGLAVGALAWAAASLMPPRTVLARLAAVPARLAAAAIATAHAGLWGLRALRHFPIEARAALR